MPEMTEAKKRANKKWNDANMAKKYDHAHVLFDKGKKQVYIEHAANRGESLNKFINRVINEAIECEKGSGTTWDEKEYTQAILRGQRHGIEK